MRGEAQPLYGLSQDVESVDTVTRTADTGSGVVSIFNNYSYDSYKFGLH